MALSPSHAPGTLISGVKTVADAATPEALTSTKTLVHVVDVQAHSSNGASITVGDSSVVHGTTTQRGIKLAAGDTWTFHDVDLSTIYVDVETNGNGVGYVATQR